MQIPLRHICQVLPGAAFRARLPERSAGDGVYVVQAKDIRSDGTIDKSRMVRIDAADVPGNAQSLQAGDVVMQPRGRAYKAGIIGKDLERAIAAAPLYTLRRVSPRVEPEWLVHFINAPTTQAALEASARGTFIPLVPRHAVAELEIKVPAIDHLRRLVALAALIRREREIAEQLMQHRVALFDALTQRLSISEGRSHAAADSSLPEGRAWTK
jgi:hypothetical protein